jgi:hypothetical protein
MKKFEWNHWLMIVLGGWIVLSPWMLGFYELNLAVWNALLVGCVIILATLWDAFSRE